MTLTRIFDSGIQVALCNGDKGVALVILEVDVKVRMVLTIQIALEHQRLMLGLHHDSRAARETIDTLRKVIPICSASCAEWRRCRRIVESHKGEEDIVNMICAQNGRPCL